MFKINKKIAILGLIILIFIFYMLIENKTSDKKINKTCFNNLCFNVEIADSEEERKKGLMFREFLDKDYGMLFILPNKGKYYFWMKNTSIPLDIIWIDDNIKVINIKENALPCTTNNCEIFSSEKEALYVLEINGGLIKEYNIKVGDEVEFK